MADLDGDGRSEVVLSPTRLGADLMVTSRGRRARVFGYDPATRRLSPRPDLPLPVDFPVLAAVDMDGDGQVDLLSADRAGSVAWGGPGGAFDPAALEPAVPMDAPLPIGSLALDDLDGDGWLDVVLGERACAPFVACCETCRVLHPLLRTGPRTFVERPGMIAEAYRVDLQAVLSTVLGAGTRVVMAVGWSRGHRPTPLYFHETGIDAEGYPQFGPFDPLPTEAPLLGGHEPPDPLGYLAEWSPMGAAVADVDGDGLLDMSLGLYPYVALLQGRTAESMVDRTFDSTLAVPEGTRHPTGTTPWVGAFLDLDQDGWQDLVVTHGNDYQSLPPGAARLPQHVGAYRGRGDFRFDEVTASLHLGRDADWRALAIDDLDGDGDGDLVVGGVGVFPRVYRNDIAVGHRGFALRFHGTTSNHLGVGARVDVTVAPGGATQHYLAGGIASPYSAAAPVVFVGLGGAAAADTVTVTWPSGTVQVLRGLSAGRVHTVEEPSVLEVTPAGRHVPADGRSAATLRVTPHAPDGSPRAAAQVVVTAFADGQRVAVPVTSQGGAWVATLPAPGARGATVLEVQINGTTLGVRPRIWWD